MDYCKTVGFVFVCLCVSPYPCSLSGPTLICDEDNRQTRNDNGAVSYNLFRIPDCNNPPINYTCDGTSPPAEPQNFASNKAIGYNFTMHWNTVNSVLGSPYNLKGFKLKVIVREYNAAPDYRNPFCYFLDINHTRPVARSNPIEGQFTQTCRIHGYNEQMIIFAWLYSYPTPAMCNSTDLIREKQPIQIQLPGRKHYVQQSSNSKGPLPVNHHTQTTLSPTCDITFPAAIAVSPTNDVTNQKDITVPVAIAVSISVCFFIIIAAIYFRHKKKGDDGSTSRGDSHASVYTLPKLQEPRRAEDDTVSDTMPEMRQPPPLPKEIRTELMSINSFHVS